MGPKTYAYLLFTVVNKDYIYTFESWGPSEQMDKDRTLLEKACRSMKIKP